VHLVGFTIGRHKGVYIVTFLFSTRCFGSFTQFFREKASKERNHVRDRHYTKKDGNV
jgi:hypothetical protein